MEDSSQPISGPAESEQGFALQNSPSTRARQLFFATQQQLSVVQPVAQTGGQIDAHSADRSEVLRRRRPRSRKSLMRPSVRLANLAIAGWLNWQRGLRPR